MFISIRHAELWLLKFSSFFAGCWVCFYFQSRFQLSAVLAASLTGFVGTFIPENKRIDSIHVQSTIYIGAFVAMGSEVVSAGVWELLLVSLIGSTIYFAITPYFKGLGGKLGAIAFISSLLGVALRHWL